MARQSGCMRAREVVVASAGVQLHGTLTMPRSGTGPYPGLLLIPGSGPIDQNGNVPGVLDDSMYRQLAQDLSCDGAAVLRFDKQGLEPSTGNGNAATLSSYVRNVRDLAVWLGHQPEIDPRRIVLMGHSEGGLIALAATPSSDVAGVILLEAPGMPLARVIADQVRAQAEARGAKAAEVAHLKAEIAAALAAVRAARGETMSVSGALAQNPYAQVFSPAAGLLRSELSVDPQALAHALHVPVLVVQGGKDLQVLPENGMRLAHAAQSGTLVELPAMTHDLIRCPQAAIDCLKPPADARLDAHLITAVTTWLRGMQALHMAGAGSADQRFHG